MSAMTRDKNFSNLYWGSQHDVKANDLKAVVEYLDTRVKDPQLRNALRIDRAKEILQKTR